MFVVRQGEIKERFDVEYFNSLRDFSIEKYEILGDIVEIK
jgi:hypothetical protein